MATKQTEANKRWQKNNLERSKYLRKRSTAKTFIEKYATNDDLLILKESFDKRENNNGK